MMVDFTDEEKLALAASPPRQWGGSDPIEDDHARARRSADRAGGPKAAGGVGTSTTGGIIGAIGIGAAVFRTVGDL
jgi:hypothetical protein